MFWENFIALCNNKGLTPNKVCADLGFSTGTATWWKKGREPRDTALQKIADYFGVTVSDLIEEKRPTPKDELLEDVIIYHRDGQTVKREFTKEQMDMLVKMIEALPEKPKDL